MLDLGLPHGDSLDLLSLEASFQFADALRNLRRLDNTLIDSAFCTHASGLRLLVLSAAGETLEHAGAAELHLLLGAFHQHFQHIVVNLAGPPDSEALRLLVSNSDQLLWCTDQSASSCRRNLALLSQWREHGVRLEHASLLIDRYLRNVAPDDQVLSKSFDLLVIEVLPFNVEMRMNAKNQGRSLFEVAPRERLSQRLKLLGEQLANIDKPAPPCGWLRLWGGSK